MSITSSTKFESLLLGARNQLLLKKCSYEICKIKNISIPKGLVHFLIYYSIKFLEDKIDKHKFSNKQLPWLNSQILMRFMDDVDNHLRKKSYWLKAELEKNISLKEKVKNKESTNIKKEEEIKNEIEFNGNKFKKNVNKKLSDLYNYS